MTTTSPAASAATAAPPATADRPPTRSAAGPAPPLSARPGEVRDVGAAHHEAVRARRWTTRGPAKVDGPVVVDEAALIGPASIGGPVSAGRLRVDGSLDLAQGAEIAGALDVDGTVRGAGGIHVGEARVRGVVQLLGALTVDRLLAVVGQLAAPSVRAGGLSLDGSAEVPGETVAREVDLRFRHPSRLGSIRATTARLSLRPPNPVELVFGRRIAVSVTRIEADSVSLEGVDVRFVRSPSIVLGRDAHLTEYEGTIVARHPSARVGPESRSPPPHGLSR